VSSSALPSYEPSDGGLATCFDVATCFAAATPVTTVDMQTCAFPLPTGATASTLNVALVTPSTGACLTAGQCDVPLPQDPNEGWTLTGGSVQLAPGVCQVLSPDTVTLVMSSGTCPAQTLAQPVCQPTSG
jgi:hypothetical protein